MYSIDKILVNATTLSPHGLPEHHKAIVIGNGIILWCGNQQALPQHYALHNPRQEDCKGRLITPGLIDCHTHLVYAGHRADEFQQRLEGLSYSDIARAGGGILSTVRQTRTVSKEQLLQQSLPRLLALLAEGVTTVEIKSGYGLDRDNEIKMLQVARELGVLSGVRIKTTFLGAHATPPEFQHNAQGYIDYLCRELLPEMCDLKLVDAVDIFCETIGFSLAQMEQLFLTAQALNLPVKCHAEQLSSMGASQLASAMGALSCDHLECLNREGAEEMARSGTVAVLLPGAYYFLRETSKPPIHLFRELGIKMAIATDCNPGSSPTTSLLLMMSMASQFFGLTVPEVLSGVTCHAAKALGLETETGAIMPGLAADLVCWESTDAAGLCYHFGYPLPHKTMIAGQWIQ